MSVWHDGSSAVCNRRTDPYEDPINRYVRRLEEENTTLRDELELAKKQRAEAQSRYDQHVADTARSCTKVSSWHEIARDQQRLRIDLGFTRKFLAGQSELPLRNHRRHSPKPRHALSKEDRRMTVDEFWKLPQEWRDIVQAMLGAGVRLKDINCHTAIGVGSLEVSLPKVARKQDSVTIPAR